MGLTDAWLAAAWPVVRAGLPPAPARVVELGCGMQGGFVPRLLDAGYDALGVDPEAPEGAPFRRERFEDAALPVRADAVVASTSLHHVAEPAAVLDRICDVLTANGSVVVVEWDWTRFDERSARWCFDRLRDEPHGWLRELRDEWLAARDEWPAFLARWAENEGIHPWPKLRSLLEERFETRHVSEGPYFFADLEETTPEDEQSSIDAGEVAATRVDYVGARGTR